METKFKLLSYSIGWNLDEINWISSTLEMYGKEYIGHQIKNKWPSQVILSSSSPIKIESSFVNYVNFWYDGTHYITIRSKN